MGIIMRRVSLFYFLFLLSLTCCISAQDLIDQERIPVTSPGVDTGWPKAAVNGNGEIGLFAMWYGGANAPDGIIFRKLDKEGKPIGPQKIVYKTNSEETRGFWIQDVVWAKDNYFVAVQNRHENRFVLLKFSQDGVLKKQLHHNHGKRVNSHQYFINGKIFGDEIYFYQTTTEGFISISA